MKHSSYLCNQIKQLRKDIKDSCQPNGSLLSLQFIRKDRKSIYQFIIKC
nr:MAG TPA: hypothetical protein [Caudoviricetes sp.]